ncbi:uncharacterized protein LOC131938266 [Physella acuta]|uniref:uncharacterized protein LOC131938266 n=1 Tax=Physella acuta TaxID=109671 RepID=UPI0027DDF2B7|nr:uncharacterized protein LOC131938266 [Physella acuta]
MEATNEQYEFIKSNQEVSKEELSNIAVKIEPKVEILETFDSVEEQIVHTVLSNVGDKDGEEVHVIYLNVDENAEPQVLDLGNLLSHEGIQIIEASNPNDQSAGETQISVCQNIVIENSCGIDIAIGESQSEAQSAHALLHLSKAQNESSHIHESSNGGQTLDDQNTTSAEALLQLSSDPNAGTYIVDEQGSMIPLSQVGSASLLEVDETEISAAALCQCWCGREFLTDEDMNRHKLAHKYQNQTMSEPGIQKCSLCLEKFATPKDLVNHLAELHPDGMPYECLVCHRKFYKKLSLKAHMRVHNTLPRYQCSTCKKIFFYKTALNRHVKTHSSERPYKCTVCGDSYPTLWDLRKHRLNHQPFRLFSCPTCSKVFRQKQTLLVHARIHTGNRPYSCDICSRSFSLKTTLVQHRLIHTGEKPNICPVCHRAFRQNSTLKAHMKIHNNLKPYICRYCKMRFAYKDEVQEHEHLHAQNKSWQCDKCGMWFKNQSLLSRHSRVHTNERPFQCSICYKTFVQSGSLQAHKRSHTKEKPYQCRMCSKSYYTSGTLLIHIRKAHNVDAKAVKDVFPVMRFIEDQKVFTIRNQPLHSSEAVVSDRTEAVLGELTGVVKDELVLTSDDMVVPQGEGETIGVDHTSVIVDLNTGAVDHNTGTVDDTSGAVDSGLEKTDSAHTAMEVEQEIECINETVENMPVEVSAETTDSTNTRDVATEMNYEEGEAVLMDQGGQDEEMAAQILHTAQDRQEAALGLAELSLKGGESLPVEKPVRTRTFFKEEEEDENDPNVTKIILSKEGGIMNSQDPHQCPVCSRIFGRKSIMIEHLRIHTDEKPYECDFCKAGFRQNAQLRSHIRNKHTKVERYQCSFCHKRFLSSSITVRHINFHHKLKVKYCESRDSAWTVKEAVWSDDNFELSVSDPFSARKKSIHEERLRKMRSDHTGYTAKDQLKKISNNSGKLMLAEDSGSKVGIVLNEEQYEEVVPSDSIEGSVAEAVVKTEVMIDEQDQATQTGEAKAMLSSDLEDSCLICGTCAMQFRGVSSLRQHLQKVHNTTLDKSDLSVVYEDDGTMFGDAVSNDIVVQCSTDSDVTVDQFKTRTLKTEDGPLKIIIFDDTATCADDPELMPYKCFMCSMRYSKKTSLQEHLKEHTDEEVEQAGMHRCDICLCVMKNTQQVTKHILKFHGVKQIFMCSICQREFFQQSSLHRHMRFFHKWEIKIRGETSIPVLVKPAPSSLQEPNGVARVNIQKDFGHSEKHKLYSTAEDGSTYINIEAGGSKNVVIFKADGQELEFDVVSSTEQRKTLKLRDTKLESVETVVDSEPKTSPASVRHTKSSQSPDGDGGKDKSTASAPNKEAALQLASQFKRGKKTKDPHKVIKVKNVNVDETSQCFTMERGVNIFKSKADPISVVAAPDKHSAAGIKSKAQRKIKPLSKGPVTQRKGPIVMSILDLDSSLGTEQTQSSRRVTLDKQASNCEDEARSDENSVVQVFVASSISRHRLAGSAGAGGATGKSGQPLDRGEEWAESGEDWVKSDEDWMDTDNEEDWMEQQGKARVKKKLAAEVASSPGSKKQIKVAPSKKHARADLSSKPKAKDAVKPVITFSPKQASTGSLPAAKESKTTSPKQASTGSLPAAKDSKTTTKSDLKACKILLKKDSNPPKKDLNPQKKDLNLAKKDLNPAKKDLNLAKKDLNPVKKDVTSVKKDVTSVKKDVTSVKKDVSSVKKTSSPTQKDAGQAPDPPLDVHERRSSSGRLIKKKEYFY